MNDKDKIFETVDETTFEEFAHKIKDSVLKAIFNLYKVSKDKILRENILNVYAIVCLSYGDSKEETIYINAGIELELVNVFGFILRDECEENVIYINNILENIMGCANYYGFEYLELAKTIKEQIENGEM